MAEKRGIAFFLNSIGSSISGLFPNLSSSAAASAGISKKAPPINMETVFYLSAYWQGVDLIAGRLSGVDLNIMNSKNEVAKDHPVQKLIKRGVSEYYDDVDFIRVMVTHIKTAGQTFMLNNYSKTGEIEELLFLSPTGTRPYLNNNRLEYHTVVDAAGAKYVPLPASRVFHVKGMTMDGINGISPLAACRPSLQLALSSMLYGLNYFANDARPSTIISTDRPITKAQAADIVASWVRENGGVNNRGVTVLPAKFNVHTLNVPPDESQAIGARQESVRDVGRVLNVPSVLLGDMEASTYNNVREAYNALDNNTLVPLGDKIVSAINRQLLSPPYHARFDWKRHFTAPQGERYAAYSQALAGNPFMLINEVRLAEGLKELTDEEIEKMFEMYRGSKDDEGGEGDEGEDEDQEEWNEE